MTDNNTIKITKDGKLIIHLLRLLLLSFLYSLGGKTSPAADKL